MLESLQLEWQRAAVALLVAVAVAYAVAVFAARLTRVVLSRAFEGDSTSKRAAMKAQGFANYPFEWWHYTHQPEPYPDTYFDFPIRPRPSGGSE
jgi:hypothetical protein